MNLSEVLNENKSFRFDSEYFRKEYLKNIIAIKKLNHIKLQDNTFRITGGATPLGANYCLEGIPFLRVQNIMQNYFNLSDVVFLNKKQDLEIKRSKLKNRDVLLTITGVSYGKSAVITKELENSNINQHSVKITLKENLNPYFLSTFLNSKQGKLQSDKNIVGVTRPALDYNVINNFIIPIFSNNFQQEIESLVVNSQEKTTQSKSLYTQAENLLLQEIGLQDFEPSKEAVNIKSFKESFGASGRLDAEYYQPFYEEVESILKGNGFTLLKDICSHINYGTVPTSLYTNNDSGTPYIKGLNLKNTEIITSKLDKITNTNELKEKFYTKKGDIIISQMGTVGDVGVVRDEENWLFASFTIRARLSNFDNFDPAFVGFYIQKIAKKYYLYRNIAQASVRQNTDLPTIRNLYIPNINILKQEQIAALIEQSFSLKKQSEHLLEIAKKAVEIAIEENEETAMNYIKTETNSI